MKTTVTPATKADLQALHDLHKASWASAYADMVPPEALGAPLDGHMARTWAELPDGVLVARRGDTAVGFIRLMIKQGWPYIDNLHVLPDLRGGGVGRVLMAAGAARLRAGEAGRVWLTVMQDNLRARRFYRSVGGYECAAMRETLLGAGVTTHPVIWTRLKDLERVASFSG